MVLLMSTALKDMLSPPLPEAIFATERVLEKSMTSGTSIRTDNCAVFDDISEAQSVITSPTKHRVPDRTAQN